MDVFRIHNTLNESADSLGAVEVAEHFGVNHHGGWNHVDKSKSGRQCSDNPALVLPGDRQPLRRKYGEADGGYREVILRYVIVQRQQRTQDDNEPAQQKHRKESPVPRLIRRKAENYG